MKIFINGFNSDYKLKGFTNVKWDNGGHILDATKPKVLDIPKKANVVIAHSCGGLQLYYHCLDNCVDFKHLILVNSVMDVDKFKLLAQSFNVTNVYNPDDKVLGKLYALSYFKYSAIDDVILKFRKMEFSDCLKYSNENFNSNIFNNCKDKAELIDLIRSKNTTFKDKFFIETAELFKSRIAGLNAMDDCNNILYSSKHIMSKSKAAYVKKINYVRTYLLNK